MPIQLTSKHFLKIARDHTLWKEFSLRDSHSEIARKRRDFLSGASIPIPEPGVFALQRAVARSTSSRDGSQKKRTDAARAMASWDPIYPGEKIDWYRDYVARHAPLSMNWLQQPRTEANIIHDGLEIQGLGLFNDSTQQSVIAPLDDGSVCLWRLGEDDFAPNVRNGRILARSRPSLLSTSGYYPISGATRTGAVECVSVDNARNKAYFAVGDGLDEVDLSTLQVSSYQQYPYPISALSLADHPVPLTVGTTLSLHIHDPRVGDNGLRSSYTYLQESLDAAQSGNGHNAQGDLHRVQNSDSSSSPSSRYDYASLSQPLPLSILHLNSSSSIHVAGRFPSILQYDRRFFPRLESTIHSGGSLCSLTSLPTPNKPTLAAAGEYNGKGSLELYPLDDSTEPTRNRASASRSKLLSITPHGTRLLFSDSDGQLKWVERDGSTLVRRWNINTYSKSTTNITPTQGIFNNDLTEDYVARKLLPVSDNERSDLLMWTGEKIGLINFGNHTRFEDFKGTDSTSSGKGSEESDYARMMRTALERQADEVRFVRGLGLRGI